MLPMKKRRRRICLTHAEKAVMWDRWKQGDSTHAIARLLDTSHMSIRRNLAPGSPATAKAFPNSLVFIGT